MKKVRFRLSWLIWIPISLFLSLGLYVLMCLLVNHITVNYINSVLESKKTDTYKEYGRPFSADENYEWIEDYLKQNPNVDINELQYRVVTKHIPSGKFIDVELIEEKNGYALCLERRHFYCLCNSNGEIIHRFDMTDDEGYMSFRLPDVIESRKKIDSIGIEFETTYWGLDGKPAKWNLLIWIENSGFWIIGGVLTAILLALIYLLIRHYRRKKKS